MNHRKNPHAIAMGRLGGLASAKVTTPAKRAASRENGKKGGRPRSKRNRLTRKPEPL